MNIVQLTKPKHFQFEVRAKVVQDQMDVLIFGMLLSRQLQYAQYFLMPLAGSNITPKLFLKYIVKCQPSFIKFLDKCTQTSTITYERLSSCNPIQLF